MIIMSLFKFLSNHLQHTLKHAKFYSKYFKIWGGGRAVNPAQRTYNLREAGTNPEVKPLHSLKDEGY